MSVELSQLPAPNMIEPLSFETIRDEMVADFSVANPDYSALVASDPAIKLIELFAYRELILRARINDAARATLLAYASGNDLDQLAANYDVERLLITPEDVSTTPPTPAVYETDKELRRRVQLAFEGLSGAGPRSGYEFHARGADANVKDVKVLESGDSAIHLVLLSRVGDGAADAALTANVLAAVNEEDVRPLTDLVTVQSATIVPYTITAQVWLYVGPGEAEALAAAEASLQAFIEARHRIGHDINLSAISAALHVPGVQRAQVDAPLADLVVLDTEAAYCTGFTVTVAGIAE